MNVVRNSSGYATRRQDRLTAIAAALVLVIGMGFGRFAFTGLYPLMVADGQISVRGGSYAASINYAGYLIGALLAGLLSGVSSRKLCAIAVVTTATMLGLLGLPLPEWLIVIVRGFAGMSSAMAMVGASHWLIHDRRHDHGAPSMFAGVGLGILVSAQIIAFGHRAALSSRSIWLVLGLAALALALITIMMQVRVDREKPVAVASLHRAKDGDSSPFGAARLVLVYGLAGFGYILTATYLPLLVRAALASVDPVHIWATFGLGAAPSCFLWHALHVRWGTSRSLAVNLLIQAVGVVLPIFHVRTAYMVSALLVGGTFMGTVTIAMPAARKMASNVRFNILAIMTGSFGVGQIVGPLMAGALYGKTQSFDASLVLAGAALLIAAALTAFGRSRRWGLGCGPQSQTRSQRTPG